MKLFAGLTAMVLAIPGLAHAAGNISGTYAIQLNETCQSIENEVFKPSTQIQTIDEGLVTRTIGLMTFKPTTAGGSSGAVSTSFTQAKGTLTILGLPGPPASPHVPDVHMGTTTKTGTYSMTVQTGTTPGSFIVTFKSDPANNFTVYFSQLSGGVYNHLDFIGIEGNMDGEAPSCVQSGTLQR
jgi:hypothetical protein